MKRGELIKFELNQTQKLIVQKMRKMGTPILTKHFLRRLYIEKQIASTINPQREINPEYQETVTESSKEGSGSKTVVKDKT